MSNEDALKLFRAKCDELGQAEVARHIGKSSAAVNQIYHGTYKGKPDAVLGKVVEIFGSLTLPCPFLGGQEISLRECAENRSRPFSAATNSYLVRFFRSCRSCKYGGGKP